ncbi:MAG: thiolase family protein [Conexibacter sp.]|nr:thiolase family protein [Conexibacter sp.]
MRGRCVIAGIGQTPSGALPGRSSTSLNVEACRAAIADAGIEKDAVDGLFVKNPSSSPQFMYAEQVAAALGLQPRAGGTFDQGGATNASMIAWAALAVAAGQCEIALVTAADNPRSGTRQLYEKPQGDDAVFGWFGVLGGYAMIARRYLAEHRLAADALGAIAVPVRRHGAANPRAQLRHEITLADYAASPAVVDPLRRDDCCLVSDGGAAVLVMSAERAAALRIADPVPILGFGQGHTATEVAQRPDLTQTCAGAAARTAFAMAGIGPRDVDVAQLYDCFTITVALTLEAYGFCAAGQATAFARDDALTAGGELPLNTSGGLLSETGMPGMQLVLEGVRQLRGESATPVDGARCCVVSNQGGVMHTHSTLVLGRS